MAGFAISEGFAPEGMKDWIDFKNAMDNNNMEGMMAAGKAIKEAWENGLEALENMEGLAKTAHQTCDPDPRNPKAMLTDLVAVGDCISSACDAESTTESP